MQKAWILSLTVVAAMLAASMPADAIRHDAGCRPAGFTGTDAPNGWMYADALGSFNCVGEMHPTAGAPNNLPYADDQDWYYLNVGATSKTLKVEICPIFVFVGGWNPNLNIFFVPQGGALPASNPSVGQALQYLQPIFGMIPMPPTLAAGSSANAAGCDTVTTGGDTAGGRFYINVARGGGGGGYSFKTTLT